MTHPDLNPFAAPRSNTSTAPTAVSLRDLFAGSFASIFQGTDGALRTGLRITLVALPLELFFSLCQSLFVMFRAPAAMGGGFFAFLSITSMIIAAGKLSEFIGTCFLWKGMPRRRLMATCCCSMLVLKFLFDYLVPRFLSAGNLGLATYVVSSTFGTGFSITRLLLLKRLTKSHNLHILANIAITGTCIMMLMSYASFYWQVSLGNTLGFTTSTGKLIHTSFLIAYGVISSIVIRVVYRVLCEKLTASNESIA